MTAAWHVMLVILAASVCSTSAHGDGNHAGLKYFQNLALESVNLTEALYDAVLEGTLTEAQEAYAASRPPYEQIETLAAAFPELDSDIDARPYAFTDGEAFNNETEAREEGKVFKGFHKVEALLFREKNVTAAEWWAAALVNSSVALAADLLGREEFTAADTWGGMIALSTEVGAKKFSSEEETFSDLSILIFENNFKGIQSQFEAYEEQVEEASPEIYREVEEALDAAFAALAPYVNKSSELGGVTPYSRVPIAARARIQAAAYTLAAELKEAAEAIEVEQEEEEEEEEECMPSVQVATFADNSASPVEAGLAYFQALMPYQLQYAANLTEAIEGANLTAARVAYLAARPFYEQFEVLAPSFSQQDSDIDAREYSFPEGEESADFKGFHRLERLLFRDGSLGASTLNYSRGLEASLEQLEGIMANSSAFAAGTNFEGIIGVATEVPAKKISSEEETSSGLSHLIFYNNWKGIYSQVAPFLSGVAPALKTELDSAVEDAAACLNITTRDDILDVNASDVTAGFVRNLVGANYGNYSRVTDEEKDCIAVNGYRIRDAVIKVARAARVLDDCHPNYASPLLQQSPNITFVAAQDAAEVPDVIAPAPAEEEEDDDGEAEAPETEAPDDDQSAAVGLNFSAALCAVGLLLFASQL